MLLKLLKKAQNFLKRKRFIMNENIESSEDQESALADVEAAETETMTESSLDIEETETTTAEYLIMEEVDETDLETIPEEKRPKATPDDFESSTAGGLNLKEMRVVRYTYESRLDSPHLVPAEGYQWQNPDDPNNYDVVAEETTTSPELENAKNEAKEKFNTELERLRDEFTWEAYLAYFGRNIKNAEFKDEIINKLNSDPSFQTKFEQGRDNYLASLEQGVQGIDSLNTEAELVDYGNELETAFEDMNLKNAAIVFVAENMMESVPEMQAALNAIKETATTVGESMPTSAYEEAAIMVMNSETRVIPADQVEAFQKKYIDLLNRETELLEQLVVKLNDIIGDPQIIVTAEDLKNLIEFDSGAYSADTYEKEVIIQALGKVAKDQPEILEELGIQLSYKGSTDPEKFDRERLEPDDHTKLAGTLTFLMANLKNVQPAEVAERLYSHKTYVDEYLAAVEAGDYDKANDLLLGSAEKREMWGGPKGLRQIALAAQRAETAKRQVYGIEATLDENDGINIGLVSDRGSGIGVQEIAKEEEVVAAPEEVVEETLEAQGPYVAGYREEINALKEEPYKFSQIEADIIDENTIIIGRGDNSNEKTTIHKEGDSWNLEDYGLGGPLELKQAVALANFINSVAGDIRNPSAVGEIMQAGEVVNEEEPFVHDEDGISLVFRGDWEQNATIGALSPVPGAGPTGAATGLLTRNHNILSQEAIDEFYKPLGLSGDDLTIALYKWYGDEGRSHEEYEDYEEDQVAEEGAATDVHHWLQNDVLGIRRMGGALGSYQVEEEGYMYNMRPVDEVDYTPDSKAFETIPDPEKNQAEFQKYADDIISSFVDQSDFNKITWSFTDEPNEIKISRSEPDAHVMYIKYDPSNDEEPWNVTKGGDYDRTYPRLDQAVAICNLVNDRSRAYHADDADWEADPDYGDQPFYIDGDTIEFAHNNWPDDTVLSPGWVGWYEKMGISRYWIKNILNDWWLE